ncbi:hypothetical protein WMW71_09125 [Flavobacterium buctense]|uniref:YD repeat-containing protein n=1 Tax=Flavobacterium buctense TaxID=1648146 RepID=A0ABU9E3B0_9FLAO|nr:hypothetical protein [Flavobacterium buctense]
MKNCCYIFIAFFMLLSCSNDTSDQANIDTNLLQRIDFYPGLAFERRWVFNTDGLLKEITKSDGTLVQDFTYDNNNRLINSTVFNDNGFNQTYTFTYDNTNFVNSVNGETVNYNASLDSYYVGNLSQNYRLTKINSEKLLVYGKTSYQDFDDDGNPYEITWDEITVTYSNNNLMSYYPNDSCNYFTYDSQTNPIRNVILPICRAFSFIENSRWVDGLYFSPNNPLSHEYCSEDPESEVYNYTYNTDNLPLIQTRDNYYLGVYENTITTAKYYYQGDVIP